jgi:hypothetical protein
MNIEQAISKLLAAIKDDYVEWTRKASKGEESSGYFKDKLDNWDNTVEVKYGNKYIKIILDRAVWGFVVNTQNDKKFEYGDILMAAGYNAPARNHARGNVFGDYKIQWTGPAYMK